MAGTLIADTLTIEGELTADEEVVVNGTLRGRLSTTNAVTIGSRGVITADIAGHSLSIAGQVTGNVTGTERVDLQPGGKLLGDVATARLTIADGAVFKGNVDMDV